MPYTGIPRRSIREVYEQLYIQKGRFFYQHYFAAEGVAEAELEADVRDALRRIYYAWSGDGTWPTDKKVGDTILSRLPDPNPFPTWLLEADIDYYVGEFEKSGFRGGLNRYRNHDRDFEFLKQFTGRRIEQPALFIAGTKDIVLSMYGDLLPYMKAELSNLRGLDLLPGCGHWTQQERPQEVTDRLVSWLRSL